MVHDCMYNRSPSVHLLKVNKTHGAWTWTLTAGRAWTIVDRGNSRRLVDHACTSGANPGLPTHSRSLSVTDAETGTELLNWHCREPLGHHISKMLSCRNKKNANLTKSSLVANEVNIELGMFGVAMMNEVGDEVDNRRAVAVNNVGLRHSSVELGQKLIRKTCEPGTYPLSHFECGNQWHGVKDYPSVGYRLPSFPL